MALSLVHTLIPSGTPFYSSCITSILTGSVILQVFMQPYTRVWETTLEVTGVSLLLISFSAVASNGIMGNEDWNSSIAAWALSIVNLLFVAVAGGRLLYEYLAEYLPSVKSMWLMWRRAHRLQKLKIIVAVFVIAVVLTLVIVAVYLWELYVEALLVVDVAWLAMLILL